MKTKGRNWRQLPEATAEECVARRALYIEKGIIIEEDPCSSSIVVSARGTSQRALLIENGLLVNRGDSGGAHA